MYQRKLVKALILGLSVICSKTQWCLCIHSNLYQSISTSSNVCHLLGLIGSQSHVFSGRNPLSRVILVEDSTWLPLWKSGKTDFYRFPCFQGAGRLEFLHRAERSVLTGRLLMKSLRSRSWTHQSCLGFCSSSSPVP